MLDQLRNVPGLVDLRLQQPDDYPVLNVDVDRTKAQQGGYTERDIGTSLLNILSGSTSFRRMFFLEPEERRQLQHRRGDPAVQHRVAAGSRRTSP